MDNSAARPGKIPSPFWLLALLGFIVPGATILQTLAVAWQLSKTDAIASVLPMIIALGAATRVVAGLPLCHWVRKHGADACCFYALLAEAIILLGMAVVLSGIGSVWLLVPLEMASALAFSAFLISRQSLLRNILVESNTSESASGVSRALTYASKLIMPVIGGSLLIFISAGMALICCCATLLIGAFLFRGRMSGYAAGNQDDGEGFSLIEIVQKTFEFYGKNSNALDSVILMALFNFILSPLAVIIPMYVSRLPSATSLHLGISEASLGAGAVCGAMLFAKVRVGSPRIFSLAVAGTSVALMVSARLDGGLGYKLFNASLFALAMSVAYSGSLFDAFFIREVPRGIYATIVGVQIFVVGATYPLGLFVSSWFFGSDYFSTIIPGYNAALSLLAFVLLQIRGSKRRLAVPPSTCKR
ncbi:putative mfs transporter transmembrane protein [Cupriavidus necator]|uniref:Putative mfs transporter transmembrane protein n=1 Tax=Cupriavidus necator TaxID=106590 RepID=A0A1K0IQN1_CUPNE|nr:putative mfs transporter transmembrane protein [Cupriavidus necator]